MRRELVLTAIVSAAIGAGLMLLATGSRPPAGIEGWRPINAEVKAALATEGSAADPGGDKASKPAETASAVDKPGEEVTGNGAAGKTEPGGGSGETVTNADAAGQNAGPSAGAESNSGVAAFKEEAGKSTDTGKISINRAGLAELQEIPGIGEKKAQAILDYRNAHGPFTSIEELTQVKGIGDKMLEKMKPYIGL
ncbi:ComEA family DNA-binding protein [Paenibacillus sp. FSL K6-2441]|uniref:ComEA family DNA-binding protein n=1 Tax=unclassified Paenibacillus TaxID=185978 RepID=UPI0021A7A964|nr:ComEA family DNA-binding protein [Paenibacillus sp. p3-SID1389]MCT2197510.1 ComEA family DNA-binding protein [Paenibacillus sp. p3-SID1389]